MSSYYEEPQECKICMNNGNDYCFACNNGNQFKPQTNADRICAMTDEELAEWLTRKIHCIDCPQEENCMLYGRSMNCRSVWLDWLKSPVEENK